MMHKFRAGHAQSGENPELLHLLRRLAMLAERPIHAIFVADGTERPAVKRLKEVKKTPVWLTDAFRDLVEAFGFVWLQVSVFYYCSVPFSTASSFDLMLPRPPVKQRQSLRR